MKKYQKIMKGLEDMLNPTLELKQTNSERNKKYW